MNLVCALRPEAGALCGSSARRDLCGGRRVTGGPTATGTDPFDYPGYPVAKDSLDKRFDTEFRSFKESRKYRYDSKGNRITE